MIVGGDKGSSPKKVLLFTNRDDIDFSNVKDLKPVQDFDLHEDFKGELEYPTKIAKFSNVTSLTLYFPENYGADTTKIYYVGLKGDYAPLPKREAIITSYESKPQLKDHQVPDESKGFRSVQ